MFQDSKRLSVATGMLTMLLCLPVCAQEISGETSTLPSVPPVSAISRGQSTANPTQREAPDAEPLASPALPEDQQAAVHSEDFLISPQDILDVSVLDVPELSRSYRVSMNGDVAIPLLSHPIHAIGETLDAFARNLEGEFQRAGLVSHPHVSVTVRSSPLHSVAITGAVARPQVFPLLGRTTLLDVISAAGGATQNAGAVVRITRGQIGREAVLNGSGENATRLANQESILTVDLKRLLESGDSRFNPSVFPGDKITVPVGGVVYVAGAVNKPGGWVLSTDRQDMSVLQALALAEDAKPTALRNKAVIIRHNNPPVGGQKEIPVNLTQITRGKAPDVNLQPNDILFVPDSSSKKAMRRGAEATIELVTGLAIWGRY